MEEPFDIAVVGAGAAGLFAAIWAGREAAAQGRPSRIIALDGAKKLGAKILVAGGGRCNVTHHAVDESAYAGASRKSIRKVLLRFGVDQTIDFFRGQGVELKREDTGKLFPVADDGRVVLDAILRAALEAGVELRHPWRVASISREGEGERAMFAITRQWSSEDSGPPDGGRRPPGEEGVLLARRVVLATGGKALPKTGSDGAGYAFARALGHTITDHVFPALVPLLLDPQHPAGEAIRALSGLSFPATLDLRSNTGKRLAMFTNSTLCTHFGLSGPGVLDISRHFLANKGSLMYLNVLPGTSPEELDALLLKAATGPARSSSILRWLMDHAPHPAIVPEHGSYGIPERLARALCRLAGDWVDGGAARAGIDPAAPLHTLTRERRRSLVETLTALRLPVTGDRGFTYAEVTAGGVPLTEIRLETMESRVCPGLHLCGEICDVDGRIGGFNFQWAWASGYVAGTSAARAAIGTHERNS